ncbi:MAG: HIT domain-containing protein [Candidatus Paceibacterota bacterium]|jgi:diadenosine tetraphosphate (Ap4A) HIT family hydrolase
MVKYCDYLKTSTKCPFCDDNQRHILDKPSAFLTYSLAPYKKDHLLICPKRHIESFFDLNIQEIEDIGSLEKLGMKILNKLGHISINILFREGDNIGKSVKHIHYHLIPNISLNSESSMPSRRILTKKEINNLIRKIKKTLKVFR